MPGRPRCQPRKMSLAACISRWPATTRCALVGVARCCPTNGLEHRGLGLLGLQEQRVAARRGRAAGRSRRGCRRCRRRRPCGRCRRAELLEQMPPVGLQRAPVARGAVRAARVELVRRLAPAQSSSIGTISGGSLMIRGWPSTSCGRACSSACMAVARPGLGHVRFGALAPAWRRMSPRSCAIQVGSTSSCAYQTSRLRIAGELAHRRRGSAPTAATHDVAPLLGREAVVAAGDREAGGQPLDVPLPRAGERLVEVVDVEDQPALGRGEHAEVGQVRVAAAAARCSPERGVAARSAAMISAAPR